MPAEGARLTVAAVRETAAIKAEGLGRRFGSVIALEDVRIDVRTGEVVAIVGPSGCGKSTLLELFAGLQAPDEGVVSGGGLDACALMPQHDLLLPWRDALGNAGLALECAGASKAEARRGAAPVFDRFGLGGFGGAHPPGVAGGVGRRAAAPRPLRAGGPGRL